MSLSESDFARGGSGPVPDGAHQDRAGALPRRLTAADIGEIVLAHLWTALAVGLIVGGLAVIALLSRPAEHEARSLLLIQLGRDYAYVPETPVSGLRTPDPGELETFVNAEIQLLDSSRVLDAAVDGLIQAGVVTAAGASRSELRDELVDAVSINLITGSHLVDIRARGATPGAAAATARALVAAYLSLRGGMIGADQPAALRAQIERTSARLGAIDREVERLTGSASLAVQDERAALVARQAGDVALALGTARAERAALAARLAALQAQQAGAAVGPVTAQVARASVLLVETEADLAAVEARITALESEDATLRDEVQRAATHAGPLSALRAERDAGLAALSQLQAQLAASEAAAQRVSDGFGPVRIIENGFVAPAPLGMPERVKLIAAALLGLLAAALAVLLAELRTRRPHSAGLAETRFGLPVLGEVEHRSRSRAMGETRHAS